MKSKKFLSSILAVVVAFGVNAAALADTAQKENASKTIQIKVGDNSAKVNGQDVKLDSPAILKDGRTLVPLRFLTESLGITPNFDSKTNTINITVPASDKKLNEQLVMATLWYQKSAEAKALYVQGYNLAKLSFDKDLEENKNDTMKRAVIVDIDETVLDNSPYEARQVRDNTAYPIGWNEWVNEAKAQAIPGAVDFLNYIVSKGADVYYITDRDVASLDVTMKNLKEQGFPQADKEHIMLKDKSKTPNDKEARRDVVKKDHRIVLLIGDNLSDLSNIFDNKSIQERFDGVDKIKAELGKRMIILPNPMYGGWEGSIYDNNFKLTDEQKDAKRKANLRFN